MSEYGSTDICIASNSSIRKLTGSIRCTNKVLFVATVYTHLSAFHIPFMRLLKKWGYEVHSAASPAEGGMDSIASEGAICWSISFSRSPFSYKNIGAVRQLRSLIKDNCYDLIHVHTPVAAWLSRYAMRRRKQGKLLYTAHGFHFSDSSHGLRNFVYYALELIAARWTNALIVINSEDYLHGQRLGFKTSENLFLVPGVGVDLKKYDAPTIDRSLFKRSLELPEGSIIVTCVAELTREKNQLQLLEAWKIVADRVPRVYLLLVGNGSYRAKIEHKLYSQGIPRVRLLGYRRDIANILAATDLFVLPSRREGLPRSILEAMAAGVSIVATSVRGNRDLVKEGLNGLLVSPNDVDALADALISLALDKSTRQRMGANSRIAVAKYSIEVVIERMSQIYSRLLDVQKKGSDETS